MALNDAGPCKLQKLSNVFDILAMFGSRQIPYVCSRLRPKVSEPIRTGTELSSQKSRHALICEGVVEVTVSLQNVVASLPFSMLRVFSKSEQLGVKPTQRSLIAVPRHTDFVVFVALAKATKAENHVRRSMPEDSCVTNIFASLRIPGDQAARNIQNHNIKSYFSLICQMGIFVSSLRRKSGN